MTALAGSSYRAQTLDERVSRVVMMLLGAAGEQQQDIARLLHITPTAVSSRLKGRTAWRVLELEAMAEHFEVPAEVFLRDPAEVFDRRRLSAVGKVPSAGPLAQSEELRTFNPRGATAKVLNFPITRAAARPSTSVL